MDVKPDYYNFQFMEEIGKNLLTKVKEINYKDIWNGRNGVTEFGSSIWTGMRDIMASTRNYS